MNSDVVGDGHFDCGTINYCTGCGRSVDVCACDVSPGARAAPKRAPDTKAGLWQSAYGHAIRGLEEMRDAYAYIANGHSPVGALTRAADAEIAARKLAAEALIDDYRRHMDSIKNSTKT